MNELVLWCDEDELKYETGAFEDRKLQMVFAFEATKLFAHSVLEPPLLDLYEFLTFSYDIIDESALKNINLRKI